MNTLYAFPYPPAAHGTEDPQCNRQEAALNRLVDLKRTERERQKRIQELEKQISKLKEVLESPLETEDQEKLDAELVRLMQIARDPTTDGPTEQRTYETRETPS